MLKLKIKNSPFWSIVCGVIGEFFIILDAAFVGAIMNGYKVKTPEILTFWALLIGGIGLRYLYEKLK